MRNSLRHRKSRVVAAVVTALALSVAVTASASASEWAQGESSMKWSATTITLKKGGNTVTCSSPALNGSLPLMGARNSEGTATGMVGNYYFHALVSCSGNTKFEFCPCIQDNGSEGEGIFAISTYNWLSGSFPEYVSPFGAYSQGEMEGVFTNGSAGKPSTLTYSNDVVGETVSGAEPITMSATFNVTTGTGGLLTLQG